MKHTIDPPADPVDFLLAHASWLGAPSMLDTLRLIQREPCRHTYDDLVSRDHEAGLYLPIMRGLYWIQPDRVAPDMSGRQPRWRLSTHKLQGDLGAFMELLEEICGRTVHGAENIEPMLRPPETWTGYVDAEEAERWRGISSNDCVGVEIELMHQWAWYRGHDPKAINYSDIFRVEKEHGLAWSHVYDEATDICTVTLYEPGTLEE